MQDFVEVPLTRGKVALVDRVDALLVSQWSWCATPSKSLWYARRSFRQGGLRFCESMHRRIMDPPPGMFVDHINGNGLDNRRSNLRVCTMSQNNTNRGRWRAPVDSPFIGVRRSGAGRDRWRATIKNGTEHVSLGTFATPEEAARAYDAAAVQSRGEFAMTNFPMGVGRSVLP